MEHIISSAAVFVINIVTVNELVMSILFQSVATNVLSILIKEYVRKDIYLMNTNLFQGKN